MSAWPCRLCSRRDGGSPGRARVSSGPLVIRLDEERAQASSRATGNEKLGQANLAALLRPSPQASGPPENYVTTTGMADVEPVAKKSKQGPPAAATIARVESSVLGPASAGRRDPPGDKAPAVSPPEIMRDVNVVSDPPSPSSEPPLELAIISDPGEDLDDELAMVFLRHMVKQDPSLVVRCVVCNLRPAPKRAALTSATPTASARRSLTACATAWPTATSACLCLNKACLNKAPEEAC